MENRRGKILIVDDKKENCGLLSEMLHHEGHEVVAVQNEAQAIQLFGEERVDIVLTDIDLLKGNGLEFLRKVKKLKPQVHVVMITGNATVDSYLKAMALGAFEYLHKPIQINILYGVISKALYDSN